MLYFTELNFRVLRRPRNQHRVSILAKLGRKRNSDLWKERVHKVWNNHGHQGRPSCHESTGHQIRSIPQLFDALENSLLRRLADVRMTAQNLRNGHSRDAKI